MMASQTMPSLSFAEMTSEGGDGEPPEEQIYRPANRYPMDEGEVEVFFKVRREAVPRFKWLYERGAFDVLRELGPLRYDVDLNKLRGNPEVLSSEGVSCWWRWLNEKYGFDAPSR